MRLARGFAAAGVFLLATVLMIVALVCCVTVVLLPLGIPLALLAVRLYAKGTKMLLPRPQEVQRGLHKLWRRRTKKVRKDTASEVKGARKKLRKARRNAGGQLEEVSKRAGKGRKGAGRRVRKLRKAAHL